MADAAASGALSTFADRLTAALCLGVGALGTTACLGALTAALRGRETQDEGYGTLIVIAVLMFGALLAAILVAISCLAMPGLRSWHGRLAVGLPLVTAAALATSAAAGLGATAAVLDALGLGGSVRGLGADGVGFLFVCGVPWAGFLGAGLLGPPPLPRGHPDARPDEAPMFGSRLAKLAGALGCGGSVAWLSGPWGVVLHSEAGPRVLLGGGALVPGAIAALVAGRWLAGRGRAPPLGRRATMWLGAMGTWWIGLAGPVVILWSVRETERLGGWGVDLSLVTSILIVAAAWLPGLWLAWRLAVTSRGTTPG